MNTKKISLALAFFITNLAYCPEKTAQDQKTEFTLRDKFNIARIVFSNGTVGVTDVLKDKMQQGAVQAKDAIAASIEQAQIAVERAKADYAKQQHDNALLEIAVLKAKIKQLEEELGRIKLQLQNAQQALSRKR